MWRPTKSSLLRSSSTSESGRAAGLPFALFLAFAAVVAGCTAFDDLTGTSGNDDGAQAPAVVRAAKPVPPPVAWTPPAAPSRIAFDHQFHLSRGPGCTDCHEGTDENDKAGMPDVEFCMACHEDIDGEKPKEKTVAAFFGKDGETPVWSNVTAQSPDVVFSHKTHIAKDIECAQCHVGIEDNKAVSHELFVDMDACTKCHTEKKAKNDCATCHRASQKSVAAGKGPYFAPANHDAGWRGVHGVVERLSAPRVRAERCDECHGKEQFPAASNCDTCHAGTKPENHDVAWRGVHGALVRDQAADASESCAVCHDQASFPESSRCDVCHVSTQPADHAQLWRDRHGQAVRRDPESVSGRCAFCHDKRGFPPEKRCTGCHLTEAPRDHSQSWRVGGGHGLSASMDRARCAACHTADTCSTCHSTTAPRSHRAAWGAPRSRHCVNCHLPLRASSLEGCGVCHQGTPSHDMAPRMPTSPPHSPDATCLKCHYQLKHADNGTNCVTCHR